MHKQEKWTPLLGQAGIAGGVYSDLTLVSGDSTVLLRRTLYRGKTFGLRFNS